MIKPLIEKVKEKLEIHKLTLAESSVEKEYAQVESTWDGIAKTIFQPVKYLIIGEATVSYKNYFYNSSSKQTPFLTPKHFNCSNKNELIELFQEKGVLVFDLYPLPLPTFIYDNVSFDCKDPDYKRLLNEYYESKLKGLIDKNTTVVLRYLKLKERFEWEIFKDFLRKHDVTIQERIKQEVNRNGNKKDIRRPLNISGSTYADPAKIKRIFNPLIER